MSKPTDRIGGLEIALVATLLALGTMLRCWRLDLGWFGVDQARDIQTALDLVARHDWPTVGPTMRRVTSLGAFYYYFWALPNLVWRDPLAAYAFAAGLGVVTLPLAWGLARRFWGERAALVTLATLATSRVAVIDARVAWAPAALPAAGVVLVWLLVGATTGWRVAILGAALGLAVQLHLTMIAWAMAAVVVVAWRRPGGRALAAGAVGFALTAWPAAYAALANAGHDAGLATLPSRGPLPSIVDRLLAVAALGWRVPEAFWQWSDATSAGWLRSVRAATLLIAVIGVLGVVRLAVAALRRDRLAGTLITALVLQVGVVVLLPGEAWYYYLDAALPLWALAAGAFVAALPAAPRASRVLGLLAGLVIVASLVQAVDLARWIAAIERHGYVVLDPAALALDGRGGRDAAAPGRLVTVGMKRALASTLATEPASFAARWRATHGPALDDVTGDNGFWLAHASGAATAVPVTHAALWYRDDPEAPSVATPGFELVTLGPFVIARYAPTIAYDTCRDEHGPVVVPMRIVPDARRYGDGTIAQPETLPGRVECRVNGGTGATRVVAAVTAGSVTLSDGAGTSGPTGRVSSICVRRGPEPVPVVVEIAQPVGVASNLDLYERPDPDCAAIKIAP